ncbi:hypothetical protein [Ammoniphilus oxalaticus]|uniref:hypothetical protein n=1 Tax=Ammoniphilus oxalaticus TaxID=66863 RepID=UPI0014756F2C|nr:hypothetical protein [Ammoniphilus oxalaticus]
MTKTQPRNRFVIMPDLKQSNTFIIYDSLLEQHIGRPGSLQSGLEMASYLNRMTPQFIK